jgi:hypothetical protein
LEELERLSLLLLRSSLLLPSLSRRLLLPSVLLLLPSVLLLLFDLLADLLDEDFPREDEERLLLRFARLALIFLCIMARLFRRFVKRIPRNMNKLPIRHNVPRAYLALLATLMLAIPWAAEEIALKLPLLAIVIRLFSGQRESSVDEHVALSLMSAPAREYSKLCPLLEL